MRDLKTLNESIDSSVSFFAENKGLNSYQLYEMPWIDDTAGLDDFLDDLYRCRSFDKYAARIVTMGASSVPVNQEKINNVCGAMIAKFYDRWLKEWAVREAEYNPVDNYNMTETMTDDERVTEYGRTNTRTDNLQHSETGSDNETKNLSSAETKNLSDQDTKNLTETTTPNLTTTETRKVNGFNSSTGVDSGTTTTNATGSSAVATTGTDTVLHSGTDTTLDTGTDNIAHTRSGSNTGTVTDAATGSDTETRNYQLTRQGNIGVTTSQQMLQSEIELWKWDFFDNVLFPDMDSVLTLKVY